MKLLIAFMYLALVTFFYVGAEYLYYGYTGKRKKIYSYPEKTSN